MRLAKEPVNLAPANPGLGPRDRRDFHLVDQVPQEGRLGQNLDTQEVARRLQVDVSDFLGPVEPARGMNVEHRGGEHHLPKSRLEPARESTGARGLTAADDVIAGVDGLQERNQVGLGPRLVSHRDQGQRGLGDANSRADRPGHAEGLRENDDLPRLPVQPGEAVGDRLLDLLGLARLAGVDHYHEYRGVLERFATKVFFKWVGELLVGRRHPNSWPRESRRVKGWSVAHALRGRPTSGGHRPPRPKDRIVRRASPPRRTQPGVNDSAPSHLRTAS